MIHIGQEINQPSSLQSWLQAGRLQQIIKSRNIQQGIWFIGFTEICPLTVGKFYDGNPPPIFENPAMFVLPLLSLQFFKIIQQCSSAPDHNLHHLRVVIIGNNQILNIILVIFTISLIACLASLKASCQSIFCKTL